VEAVRTQDWRISERACTSQFESYFLTSVFLLDVLIMWSKSVYRSERFVHSYQINRRQSSGKKIRMMETKHQVHQFNVSRYSSDSSFETDQTASSV
jgi:hypothetical protein